MVIQSQEDIRVAGEAGDGAEALARLGVTAADVVLMDVRMPHMDGVEATGRLLARTGEPPRVIVLTTFDLDEYTFAALRAGASGFLLKDAPAEDMLAAIRTVHRVRVMSARAEHDAPDLCGAIAEERPDALLVDINSWGAMAAAEAWGGPWSVFCPYPIALGSRDTPPFGPGLPPARGPLGRLRDRLVRPLVLGVLEKMFLPPLNHVRTQAGAAPVHDADEMFRRPPLLIYNR